MPKKPLLTVAALITGLAGGRTAAQKISVPVRGGVAFSVTDNITWLVEGDCAMSGRQFKILLAGSSVMPAGALNKFQVNVNVWVANNMDLKMPVPKIPANASIMEQFKLVTEAIVKYIMESRRGILWDKST